MNCMTRRQFFRILIIEQIGVPILMLPAFVSRYQEQRIWNVVILLLIGGLLGIFEILLLPSEKEGERTYSEYLENTFGKIFGNILNGLYLLRFLFRGCLLTYLLAGYIRNLFSFSSGIVYLMIPFFLVIAYALTKTAKTRWRMLEVIFWGVIVPLLLLLVIGLNTVNMQNVREQISGFSGKNIVSRIYEGFFFFLAVEFLLYQRFFVRFSSKEEKQQKGSEDVLKETSQRSFMTKGNFFAGWTVLSALVIFSVIETLGMYGPNMVQKLKYPFLDMMENVKIPGGFVERVDLFFMIFLIFAMFSTISGYFYYSYDICCHFLEKKNREKYICVMQWVWILAAYVIYDIICYFKPGIKFLTVYGKYFDVPVFFVVLLLLCLAKWIKKGKKQRG